MFCISNTIHLFLWRFSPVHDLDKILPYSNHSKKKNPKWAKMFPFRILRWRLGLDWGEGLRWRTALISYQWKILTSPLCVFTHFCIYTFVCLHISVSTPDCGCVRPCCYFPVISAPPNPLLSEWKDVFHCAMVMSMGELTFQFSWTSLTQRIPVPPCEHKQRCEIKASRRSPAPGEKAA